MRLVYTALAILLLTAPAMARQFCLPHKEAVLRLQRDHGETARGVGVGNNGELVTQLFVSDTGSWTVLGTRTNGTSCILASGDSWMMLEGKLMKEETPA